MHPDEMWVDEGDEDAWQVRDCDGDRMFRIPKSFAPDKERADVLMRWVLKIANAERKKGEKRGASDARAEIRAAIGF